MVPKDLMPIMMEHTSQDERVIPVKGTKWPCIHVARSVLQNTMENKLRQIVILYCFSLSSLFYSSMNFEFYVRKWRIWVHLTRQTPL